MFGKKKEAKKKEVKEEKKPTVKKQEDKKAATGKVPTKKTSASSKKQEEKKSSVYRVVYDKEKGFWQIKRDGAKRVIDSKRTKEEALARVKELSESQDVGFVVHKKDGKFQKK